MADNEYAPPVDIFAPNNPDGTVWGYPLELADIQTAALSRHPWRFTGETLAQYAARVGPFWLDATPEEIARWYDEAAAYPA